MTTDELLEALKPYGVNLRWIVSANVWEVILYDWAFLHVEHVNLPAALQAAWERVQVEQVE